MSQVISSVTPLSAFSGKSDLNSAAVSFSMVRDRRALQAARQAKSRAPRPSLSAQKSAQTIFEVSMSEQTGTAFQKVPRRRSQTDSRVP